MVVQDEVSLFPALVENMLLYRCMRSRQEEHKLDPDKYGDVGQLMGHMPILLVAGDFLQIKPAREIAIADDLEALGNTSTIVHPEHHTAQEAILGIADVIHLTKSKRFLDEAMPVVMQAIRTSRPDAPLAEAELEKLRGRKIERCQDIWTPKYHPMESRAFEKASTSKLFYCKAFLEISFPTKEVPSRMASALHLLFFWCSSCRRSLTRLCSLTGTS